MILHNSFVPSLNLERSVCGARATATATISSKAVIIAACSFIALSPSSFLFGSAFKFLYQRRNHLHALGVVQVRPEESSSVRRAQESLDGLVNVGEFSIVECLVGDAAWESHHLPLRSRNEVAMPGTDFRPLPELLWVGELVLRVEYRLQHGEVVLVELRRPRYSEGEAQKLSDFHRLHRRQKLGEIGRAHV